jgi:hypothetical protein
MHNERILNWSIGVLVLFDIFARTWLERHVPALHWLFVFVPLALLAWSVVLALRRLSPADPPTSFPHQQLQPGDFFRVFFVLWAGHNALAAKHVLGFYVFSAIAALLLFFLITVVGIELFQRRRINGWVIGCGLFVYCLLSWEHHMFVRHYGVPIIGHFFERPEYDARYYVQAERESSNQKYRLLADIHVEGRSETDDAGEDRFGQTIFETTTYRDVWVRRLHFPNGGSVAIDDQMEPLHLGDSVFVTDTRGDKWYLKLLNEYAH